jgi:hypothetical protein
VKAQVVGLTETLRDLNKLDKELSKEIRKDIRKAAQPIADSINKAIPSNAPLSGLDHSGRTGWNNRKKVAVKLDTRRPRRNVQRPGRTMLNVVRVTTKDAPTAIVDMAGRAGGTASRAAYGRRRPNFAPALNRALGPASRFMYPNAEESLPKAQREIADIVTKVEKIMNRQLANTYRSF